MTYVLNDASVLPATEVKQTAAASAGPGFWQRLYAAMIESRRRSALRELRAYSYRINESGILLGGIPATTLSSGETLPFNR